MIITVTLNAAIDKTMAVPNFQPGRRHRTVDQTEMPGGKGVNIARVLKALGHPVIATGLAIPRASAARRIQDVLTQPWILVVLGAILIAVALLTQRRTPRPREEPV